MPAPSKRPDAFASEYFLWLATVEPEERNRIATVLEEVDVKTPADLALLAQRMIVEVIRGNVAPEVADATHKWAELMLAALTVEAARTGKNTNIIMQFSQHSMETIDTVARIREKSADLRTPPVKIEQDQVLESTDIEERKVG